jgi:hypothetical protein
VVVRGYGLVELFIVCERTDACESAVIDFLIGYHLRTAPRVYVRDPASVVLFFSCGEFVYHYAEARYQYSRVANTYASAFLST